MNNNDDFINTLGHRFSNSFMNYCKNQTDKAQYDKSYICTILGVNRDFTDDVSNEEQEKLVKDFAIPEVKGKENYYTVNINGVYHCIKSENNFKLYQSVRVIVPRGDWSSLYIEGVYKAEKANAPLKQGEIRFTSGRLYVGDEEYRLQRGSGRRIIAVTRGKKCTQIYADTEAESEAAAIAAVMRGLDEPWDIEFDEYIDGDGYSVYLSSIIGLGECTSVEVDYGDGSEIFKGGALAPHIYEKQGIYHIRIKTDAKEITQLSLSSWERLEETNPERFNEGTSVHIGGGIEAVYNMSGYSQEIGRLTWGESVKYISGFQFVANKLQKDRLDISLPPFFVGAFKGGEKLEHVILTYAHLDYLYIPASCIYISYHGFQGVSLSMLEIEPEGEPLEMGNWTFIGGASGSGVCFSEIKALDIPARVSFGAGGHYFDDCGVRVIRLQKGITSIPENCFYGCNTSGGFSVGNSSVVLRGSHPLYVFIPKTVASIESSAFGGAVNILYEGSDSEWEAIAKNSGWCCGNDSKCNIECCNGSSVYYGAFDFLAANLRDVYSGGEGISVSGDGTVSVKPASPSTYELGGVVPDSDGFDYDPDTGVLKLKIASKDKPGIIKIGKGIQITTDPQTGKGGYADVLLGKGMRFESIVDENGDVIEYPVSLDLDKGLKFNGIVDEQTGEVTQSKLALDTGAGLTLEQYADVDEETAHRLAVDIGDGLTFEEYTDENGDTLKRIVPNIGENLEIGADGKINAKGGGVALTAGNGIDIQNDIVSVKVDGNTVKFNENKELTAAGGVVIDKAVILQEAEAKYILHNFTQVKYMAGNKIGYAGPGNPIIVDGYMIYKNVNDVIALYSAPYTSAVFARSDIYNNDWTTAGECDYYMRLGKVTTDYSLIALASNAKQYNNTGNISTYNGAETLDLSRSGIAFVWSNIYSPLQMPDKFPYGYAHGQVHLINVSQTGDLGYSQSLWARWGFASMAEYEAAVGLTYEPLTLTRVEDNPTIM